MGVTALLLFVVLRAFDIYGDPGQWSTQKTGIQTFFDFMDVQKYPPSLLYMSATIGCALIFLSLIKNTSGRFSKFAIVFGRVPFFYYILHFYVLHIFSIIMFLSRGHSIAEGVEGVPNMPFKFAVPGEGYALWIVYATILIKHIIKKNGGSAIYKKL